GIPSREDVPIPLPPTPEELALATTDAERAVLMRRHRMAANHAMRANADLHSLRCDMALKMKVAEQFRDDVLYYPHNVDFRGRAYPVPPHLNHMGADVCRGLLVFAHGKPLGARGLRWLKIHLSNLMGKDKVSFDDREAYTEAHMEEVFKCYDDPLGEGTWWQGADAPWQALAACRELTLAYRSGHPLDYECHLPVHQDGSCNGLQHYAALGRDASGGRAVNLMPTEEDKPQDVYSKVLQLVLKRVEEDAASFDTSHPMTLTQAYASVNAAADASARTVVSNNIRALAAEFLRGHVDRKVVKQTVMTSVYGVTFIGARQQILNRLKEKFEGHPMPVDELEQTLFLCASYLARTTLDSLGDLFASADAIKRWLGDVARLVALADQPMSWVTPLGLPVVQPYRRERSMMIKTVLQDV
ncbi:hypothetical protein EON62_05090, partial [archaeon]